jgi:hypothetical protein
MGWDGMENNGERIGSGKENVVGGVVVMSCGTTEFVVLYYGRLLL